MGIENGALIFQRSSVTNREYGTRPVFRIRSSLTRCSANLWENFGFESTYDFDVFWFKPLSTGSAREDEENF